MDLDRDSDPVGHNNNGLHHFPQLPAVSTLGHPLGLEQSEKATSGSPVSDLTPRRQRKIPQARSSLVCLPSTMLKKIRDSSKGIESIDRKRTKILPKDRDYPPYCPPGGSLTDGESHGLKEKPNVCVPPFCVN